MRRLLAFLTLATLVLAAGQSGEGEGKGSFFRKRVEGGWAVTLTAAGESPLTVTIPDADVAAAREEFGYSGEDLARLTDACLAQACGAAEMARRADRFYASRGVEVTYGPKVDTHRADLTAMIARNKPRLAALAAAIARRHEDLDERIAFAAALVQSALAYEEIPAVEDGRIVFGLHPPPLTLVLGSGDCDAKGVLLATLLAHWEGVEVISVRLGDHAFLAVNRPIKPGARAVHFRGRDWLAIETAGPGRFAPGRLGEETDERLKSGETPQVDRLF